MRAAGDGRGDVAMGWQCHARMARIDDRIPEPGRRQVAAPAGGRRRGASFQPRDASPRAVDDADETGRHRSRRYRLAMAAGDGPDYRLIRAPTWRFSAPCRADLFWREDAPRRKPSPDVGSRGARTPACWRCSRVRAIPAPRASLPRIAANATRMSGATCADARGVSTHA